MVYSWTNSEINFWRHLAKLLDYCPTFLLPDMPKISLICLAVKNYVPCFHSAANWRLIQWEGKERRKRSEIPHKCRFMKLHSKLHLTFIPRFYSIACLSKLRSIITSLRETSLPTFLWDEAKRRPGEAWLKHIAEAPLP